MAKEKKNNKDNDKIFIRCTVAIILTIILALIFYVCYDKGYILKDEIPAKEEVEKTEPEKQEQAKENDNSITNTMLKEDLSEKIDYMTGFDSKSEHSSTATFRNNSASDFGDFFNDFNDDVKLHTVLTYLKDTNQFSKITYDNKSSYVISDYAASNSYDNILQISANDVNKQYYLFYGKYIENFKSIGYCYRFLYDKYLNMFFWVVPQCNNNSNNYILSYKSQFTSPSSDIANVYVSYALIEKNDSKVANTYNIYKDFTNKYLYQENVSKDTADNFKLDESNYKDFSEYKYTFKKDSNNNYYFQSVEKTK